MYFIDAQCTNSIKNTRNIKFTPFELNGLSIPYSVGPAHFKFKVVEWYFIQLLVEHSVSRR